MLRYALAFLMVVLFKYGECSEKPTSAIRYSSGQSQSEPRRDSYRAVLSLEVAGDEHAEWGRKKEAEESYRKALEALGPQQLRRNQFKRADLMLKLARATNGTEEKQDLVRQAHAINTQYPNLRRAQIASTSLDLMKFAVAEFHTEEFLKYSEKVEAIYRKVPPSEVTPDMLVGRMIQLWHEGRAASDGPDEIIAIIARVLNQEPSKETLIGFCDAAGMIRDLAGSNLPKIAELLERCKNLMEISLPANHPEIAAHAMQLASIYLTAGQTERADQMLLEIESREEHIPLRINLPSLSINSSEAGAESAGNPAGLINAYLSAATMAYLPYAFPYRAHSTRALGDIYYQQVVSLLSNEKVPFDADLAYGLGTLAKNLDSLGLREQARILMEHSINIRYRETVPNLAWIASDMVQLGSTYVALEEFEKAESVLLATVDLAEADGATNYPWVAQAYVSLADIYNFLDDREKLSQLVFHFNQYIDRTTPEFKHATDDPRAIRAQLFERMNDLDAASQNIEMLLNELREDNSQSTALGVLHYRLGRIRESQGEDDHAIEHFEKAAKILEKDTGVAYRLSQIYRKRERHTDALRVIERVWADFLSSADPNKTDFLLEAAHVFALNNQTARSELFVHEAIDSARKLPSGGVLQRKAMREIGYYYCSLSRFEEGIAILEHLVANKIEGIYENRRKFDETIHALHILGRCYAATANHARAISAFRLAAEAMHSSDFPSSLWEGLLLSAMAREMFFSKDYISAVETFQRALHLWATNTLDPNTLAPTYFYLKLVLAALGRHDEAQAVEHAATDNLKKTDLKNSRYQVMTQLMNAEIGRFKVGGNYELLDTYLRTSAKLANELRRSETPSRSELAKLAGLHLQQGWNIYQSQKSAEILSAGFVIGQSLLRSISADALSQSIAENAAPSSLHRMFLRGLHKEKAKHRENREQFVHSWATPKTEQAFRLAAHASWMSSQSAPDSDLESRIGTSYPELSEIIDTSPVDIKNLQLLLKPGQALFFILPSEGATHLWIVRQERAEWLMLPIDSKRISELVKRIKASLDPTFLMSREYDYRAAHELYSLIFQPAEQFLAGVSEVISVADGILATIPLGILMEEVPQDSGVPAIEAYKSMRWLIRKYSFSSLPSISSLRLLRTFENRRASSTPFSFFGVGNPVLQAAPLERQEYGLKNDPAIRGIGTIENAQKIGNAIVTLADLPELPDTEDELRAIAATLREGEQNLLLGKEATESNLKRQKLDRYSVIAFATHGVVSNEVNGITEPGLVLTQPASRSFDDDGYLSAREITELKLNADWVILSGCNTAAPSGGSSEPMSGLAKAFFVAGARSLLVSNWSVVSNAAKSLISDTIRTYMDTPAIGKAAALRDATLKMIDDARIPEYAHPAVWGPFVLVGVGR